MYPVPLNNCAKKHDSTPYEFGYYCTESYRRTCEIVTRRQNSMSILKIFRSAALVFILVNGCLSAAELQTYNDGKDLLHHCTYRELDPLLLKIKVPTETPACAEPKKEEPVPQKGTISLCIGKIKCAYQNNKDNSVGWLTKSVGCEPNPNGTCPPPLNCYSNNSPAIAGANVKPKIQTKEDALAEAKTSGWHHGQEIGSSTNRLSQSEPVRH